MIVYIVKFPGDGVGLGEVADVQEKRTKGTMSL